MSKANILIADDGLVMRTIVSRKLSEKGYQVTAATNGIEVIEALNHDRFDLLLLDIYMPGMNGMDTLRTIRQTYSRIQLPIIMATSKDDEEDIVSCFNDGANDFVAKPINFPILFARIDTHLQLKRATDELEALR